MVMKLHRWMNSHAFEFYDKTDEMKLSTGVVIDLGVGPPIDVEWHGLIWSEDGIH